MVMGEAAGRAAVLAIDGVKAGTSRPTGLPIPVQDISVPALQAALRRTGSVLDVPITLTPSSGEAAGG